ncbi:hypothetical protein DEJ28_15100 [Curtobacterium sp. MCPF17_002]|uniref:hypothetical protein n=1 Tax=Curtobacterium sp. MCPF17_002 TaxID=2175645 RepID=UPI000DA9AB2C|nr:hypothetical protein [Curtobacterium sp. MCPF17_002]WIB76965.1 hypothetical protein DEJ28_15100 [Curtobacterium sp. MCPF17_002]
MDHGWNVDIAGSKAVIDKAASAGSSMQGAAVDVDTALRDTVAALTGTDAVGAAQALLDDRRGDAMTAVHAVERGITAATTAMRAFAEADATMAGDTTTANASTDGRSAP